MKRCSRNYTKWILISISTAFFLLMLVLPLIEIIYRALKDGWDTYKTALTSQYTISALKVTLIATICALTVNTFFGVAAAWVITKFDFRGKNVLLTLIDIPFSISPVIVGLAYIMTFGRSGWAAPFVDRINELLGTDISFVFSIPGVVLVTIFVTFPFISREIIPVLNVVGRDEEVAAAQMGASGFTIFREITFPHMKWGLIYGMILCSARAFGEFGAVYAVSKTRGKTFTLPLEIDALYMAGSADSITQAFAVSSLLAGIAVIMLILKHIAEYYGRQRKL